MIAYRIRLLPNDEVRTYFMKVRPSPIRRNWATLSTEDRTPPNRSQSLHYPIIYGKRKPLWTCILLTRSGFFCWLLVGLSLTIRGEIVKFFANKLNGNYLRNVLPGPDVEVDWVRAAIAYGSDSSTLIDNCINNCRRLDIWMRYDHTVPVAPPLLKKLLQSTNRNIFCYLIPDVHHAKVIWWKNHGVYIGSANLTERAWITNIEFGVFISESDLETSGEISEIESFFDFLENCDAAFELNDEIVKEQEIIWALRSKKEDPLNREAEAIRKIKKWEGPAYVASKVRCKGSRLKKTGLAIIPFFGSN
jgi:hypothetical protein